MVDGLGQMPSGFRLGMARLDNPVQGQCSQTSLSRPIMECYDRLAKVLLENILLMCTASYQNLSPFRFLKSSPWPVVERRALGHPFGEESRDDPNIALEVFWL